MRKIQNLTFFVALCVVIALSGCKKYEDGPGFSLSSKKARLSADWEFKKVLINSLDVTSDFFDYSWEIKKDGGFKLVSGGFIESGKWEFVSNKEAIDFDYSDGYIERYNIKRLTSKELWIENIEDGDTLYLELTAK